MAGEEVRRRLAAIVAADMVGYSRLMELDESGTVARQKACLNDLILPKIHEFEGRLVKTTGDGLLAEFASAVDAVMFSATIQREMIARESEISNERRIRYRVGINVGEIIHDEGDIFGEGVNVAARLEALAEPGGILISESVFNTIKGKLDLGFADLGAQTVKNISQPIKVFQVLLDPRDVGKLVRSSPRPTVPWSRLATLTGLLVLAVGLAGYFLWDRQNLQQAEVAPRLLILPYQPTTADAQLQAEALSENLWLTMARIKGISMVPRGAALSIAGVDPTVAQIDGFGDVTHILDGVVTKTGEGTRLSNRLRRISGEAIETVWQREDTAGTQNMFTVLNRQKSAVITELKLALNANEREALNQTFTANLAAFVAYAKAEHLYNTSQWNNFREALDLFKLAYEADPVFVAAKLGYGKTNFHVWRAEWSNVRNTLQARLAAEEVVGDILATDPNNPDALSLQVFITLWMLHRDEALALAKSAIFKNPNSPTGRNALGWVLLATGDYVSARKEFETYFKTAARLSQKETDFLSNAYRKLNDPQRALSLLLPLHDVNASYQALDWGLAEAYSRAGDVDAARRNLERAMRAVPWFSLAWDRPFYDIYEDPSVYENFAKAAMAAGMPEWPYNLDKVLAANRLNEEELRALTEPGFKTDSATDELGGPFHIEVRPDGTVEWRNSFLPTVYRGVWKIESNRFCLRFPDLYKGFYTCELFFTDAQKDTPGLRHYVMLSSFGPRKLAIAHRAE
ncbi:MAG: adenylate/guanylate cyclase domain-containing protein [Rhizobiaceae bacterium]